MIIAILLVFTLLNYNCIQTGSRLSEKDSFSYESSKIDVFFNHMTDDELVEEIEKVERSLKLYIYPLPEDEVTKRLGGLDSMPHFQSEFMFRQYLQKFHRNHMNNIPTTDSRKYMIVDNPEEANVFLIDHEWMRYSKHQCEGALNKHIGTVVKNVVDNYPYYNRSNGRDHFMMGVYDKGAFCDMMCSDRGNKQILFRISNASFIGNYGMDRDTFYESPNSLELRNNYKRFGVPCHRAGYDIVIPQLIQYDATHLHQEYLDTHIPYREFDSSFAGSDWGERQPVHKMAKSQEQDYISHHVENFVHLDGGSPDHSLKYRGYFMYHPCGYACWSQRLYEALAVYTIPIIVTDGGIQAFERFIDWRRFTVKMSLSTWYNDTLRTEFRTKIRNESDLFRDRLIDCWQSLQIPTSNLTKGNPKHYLKDEDFKDIGYLGYFRRESRQLSKDWLYAARNNTNEKCRMVLDTFVWKKMMAIQRVLPWLDFNNAHETKYNAFRLLTLEMWCHIKIYSDNNNTRNINIPDICNHRVDFTSRIEYFYPMTSE